MVVNDKALYNDNISTDFELHPAEQTELVYKILKLAGLSIEDVQLQSTGASLETIQTQQEKHSTLTQK